MFQKTLPGQDLCCVTNWSNRDSKGTTALTRKDKTYEENNYSALYAMLYLNYCQLKC